MSWKSSWLLLLSLTPVVSYPQEPCRSDEACLSWQAPTQFENGAPIPAGAIVAFFRNLIRKLT